jgi:hypothetical protein
MKATNTGYLVLTAETLTNIIKATNTGHSDLTAKTLTHMIKEIFCPTEICMQIYFGTTLLLFNSVPIQG